MSKPVFRGLVVFTFLSFGLPAHAKTFADLWPDLAADPALAEQVKLLEKLDFKTCTVTLPGGKVTLNQGEAFYTLSPQDANYVLTELWGNPPGPDTLGMVFPIWATPMHSDAWGALLEWDASGHVKDEDAATINFDELLRNMKADAEASNKDRAAQGFERMSLLGWAEPPNYDAATHKLCWAKELSFEGQPENTLNYNIRILGREGVLNMNVISGMAQLDAIRQDAPGTVGNDGFHHRQPLRRLQARRRQGGGLWHRRADRGRCLGQDRDAGRGAAGVQEVLVPCTRAAGLAEEPVLAQGRQLISLRRRIAAAREL